MLKKREQLFLGSLVSVLLALVILFIFGQMVQQAKAHPATQASEVSSSASAVASSSSTSASRQPERIEKSMDAKLAVMQQDFATMSAYGLYYDYANMTLPEVVQAYMTEYGIDTQAVAFSYKNTVTGEIYAMNDTQPMTAGSTYKLPLNMLVVDAVDEGKYSLDQKFDITQTDYELLSEHEAYVAQFDGAMTIPEMQEYSLVYSENTPAYALAERLGGMDKAYTMFDKYGQSKGDIKTIQQDGNKTTTDYYIQVLDYLWNHQDKYADIIFYMEESFPGDYYKRYWPDLRIVQKPGYVREALNIDAMVFEDTPYLIALYTKGLGGSTEESDEINGYGYSQLTQLTYVINEWHRVNGNVS